jgi:hypothetical protein
MPHLRSEHRPLLQNGFAQKEKWGAHFVTKKKVPDAQKSSSDFDEAASTAIRNGLNQVDEVAEGVSRADEEVRKYVEERRDSIARGARRSKSRFRL